MRGLSTKSCQVVNVGLRGHKQWWNLDPLSIARRPVVVGRGGRREAGGGRREAVGVVAVVVAVVAVVTVVTVVTVVVNASWLR